MSEPQNEKSKQPADLISTERNESSSDFIRDAIKEDLKQGRFDKVITRFPPEPNAYLHIGHAKAIWIDFGIAKEFGGHCNLRFDDTNPAKEEQEYVDGIQEDVRWLGADWGDNLFFGSDYFEQMYEWAIELIKKGKAYVCDLSPEEVSKKRGTITEPGEDSPYRNRPIEESLDLFQRMRNGEFSDGACTLRAKIDMSSPNMNLRDPMMYRIRKVEHHRQGSKWCIYPMYDWAHGLEDSIEGITHSLCSLEYEIHRPLYDWYLDQLNIYHPRQIEFARLNLTYTVMSKRRFIELVDGGYVKGYDDPRLPTLAGLRRRGYTPEAIYEFCKRIGVAKTDSLVDVAVLEDCVREDLNKKTQRVMAVMNPLKVVLTNYPVDQVENLDIVNNPEDPDAGTRKVPFAHEIYIERDDFREDPPPKYFRLAPGREVRLRNAYFIKCENVLKDENGEIVELHCTYDPLTRGGDAPDGRKVKATIHWVAAQQAIPAEARLYSHLFIKPNPDEFENGQNYFSNLTPDSEQITTCYVEPSVAGSTPGTRFQFERQGYFCVDSDSSSENLCFNRTVTLRDSWAKIEKAMNTGSKKK